MILRIIGFELRYYLRRISTWVYFALLFAIGFLEMNLAGGAFSSVSATAGGKEMANAPLSIALWMTLASLFGTIVVAALVGNSVHRDYETGIHPLFFTLPIKRRDYLAGRFIGSLLVNVLIYLSIPLGIAFATLMPYLEHDRLEPGRPMAYVLPFLVLVLPNLLLTGAIFFSLAALTRQMLSNYVGGVVLVIGYVTAGSFIDKLESRRLAALIDPFGFNGLENTTRYWSVAEKNTQLVGMSGELLLNRLIWMGVAAVVFALCYRAFRFAHQAPARRRRGAVADDLAEAAPRAVPVRLVLPDVPRFFAGRAQWTMLWSTFRREFQAIVRNVYFYAIVAAGVAFLVASSTTVGQLYGTNTYPVTYSVIEILSASFALFVLIVITFYAGEMVWRERDQRSEQIHDALPVPTWVPFAAKLGALVAVVALLLAVVMVAGILTQAFKGYDRFEIPLYLKGLFGVQLVRYLYVCVMALLIHTLVNNKYVGHALVIILFLSSSILPQMGLEHHLYRYASDSGMTYSDMNGYGPFWRPWLWWRAYWATFALLLVALTALYWVRGQETAWRTRTRVARARFHGPVRALTALSALAFLALGGWTYYNTTVVNEYRTSKQDERAQADYEKLYKRFEGIAQPRIVSTRLDVDIFPETGGLHVRGHYGLRNRTAQPIDSVHVRIQRGARLRSLSFGRPAALALNDGERSYRIYRLATPLQPGDSMPMDFELAYEPHGFPNQVTSTEVVGNGTFFSNDVLPQIGYDAGRELEQTSTRKRYGLKPRLRMAPPEDQKARLNNYVSQDADWIDLETTVSTSADQTAVAPGRLLREWTAGGRRYFHYRMDSPVLNIYGFLSARYAVKRDRWRDVSIEVLYHPEHAYNVDRMIAAVKRSLDYYTANFGPYQHKQVRIVEFPRYASYAQSLPNMIPFSEAIGFVARVKGPDAIDYPFYVTAHEVAHQWWAHQVIGANVQGATLLSETLAQYSALMVMEKEYGREKMKRFLSFELDSYLTGRAVERERESPLLRVEGQQYLHYRKGSLVMYELRDLLGEQRLNAALAAYLRDVRFQQPPYTTSLEFYRYIQAATPDSLKGAVDDLFTRITLFENKAVQATARPAAGGRYTVDVTVDAQKMYADSLGSEKPARMDDMVEIGVFGAAPRGEDKDNGPVLYLARHRIHGGRQHVVVTVDGVPARAGIDPMNKLVDRHADDNTVAVQVAGAGKH
jgi:ABC-2 type transport system permease protein